MKLLTLNTHSWMEDHPEKKLEQLVEHILQEDYDIVCLQEINQLMTTSRVVAPADYQALPSAPILHEDHYAYLLTGKLAQKGKRYYWSWAYNHIGYDRYHEGVALLSKTPIEVQELLVSDVDDETDYHTRRILLATTEVTGRALTVASLHLSWFGKGFEGEWQIIEDHLQSHSYPIILMGDFNNPTDQEGYSMIVNSSLNVVDSHQVASHVLGNYTILANIDGWEGNQQALKVDHAFVSKTLNVVSSKVIFDGKATPILSDHFGLDIDIEWNEVSETVFTS
ncbi:endonuclease/exonuclease/phosphatase family protein [Streptococcus sp. S784/96/1]|uniref:endonuclease/exonuclease/phosphatase family protein n=1 Tax=Streptococcus sp. S784/96/1 TaxID=2653499 RepID=UPI00138A3DCB|nr:endonuclease/exonuclease/phosphatase family protein [Streptococcus sp. S784/96/1]